MERAAPKSGVFRVGAERYVTSAVLGSWPLSDPPKKWRVTLVALYFAWFAEATQRILLLLEGGVSCGAILFRNFLTSSCFKRALSEGVNS